MKNKEQIFKAVFFGSILLFITSLFFCGYSTSKDSEESYGGLLVLFGWSEVFSEGAGYVWLANPMLWVAWRYRNRKHISLWFSILSVVIATMFLFSVRIMPMGICGSWLEMSDCDPIEIINVNAGYYLWLSSSILFMGGNVCRMNFRSLRKAEVS